MVVRNPEMVVAKHPEYESVEEIPVDTFATVIPETEVTTINEEPTINTMEDIERESIRAALARNKGSRKLAATELHISERTLYRKIKEYEL
jgi:transcriptional regulator with PAS, ATPase and Fis domain